MGRKSKRIVHSELEITAMASDGYGIGRTNDKVVFVENAVPGDVVDARTFQRRKKFDKARLVNLHTASELRQEPFCAHYDVCGGCKWQHLQYEHQIAYKHQIVQDAFARLGKVEVGEVLPILPAKKITAYRNKMEYTFSATRWMTHNEINGDEALDKRGLGLHVPGNFAKVVNLDKCYLQEDISNQIRNSVGQYCKDNDLQYFNIQDKEGLMRNLVIRPTTTGDLLVLVIFFEDRSEQIAGLMAYLGETFPQITSLNYIVNNKRNDDYSDQEVINVKGKDHIIERMGDYDFKIRPKSFFQTNTEQGVALYNIVKDFAQLQGDEVLYDLYSGVGSIGIFLSGDCKKVVGIEQIDQAVEDAKENAKLNKVENTHYYVGDVRMLLNKDFLAQNEAPDVLVTDPPRAGMHPEVVETLLQAEVPKMVYVSCNPSTQARDIELLSTKYDVIKIQAVDMFPHTVHIENVALLTLKK